MLEPDSLPAAFSGVDAVITSAVGYTKRRKTDSGDTDVQGNRNLADAAARAGVRRFVLTSILRCDEARDVPHFWNKVIAEEDLRDPVGALRLAPAGGLLRPGDGPAAGWGRPGRPGGEHVAGRRDAELGALTRRGRGARPAGRRTGRRRKPYRPGVDPLVSMQEVATLAAQALGRPVRLVEAALAPGQRRRRADRSGQRPGGGHDRDGTVLHHRPLCGRRRARPPGESRPVPTPEEAVARWAASPLLTR